LIGHAIVRQLRSFIRVKPNRISFLCSSLREIVLYFYKKCHHLIIHHLNIPRDKMAKPYLFRRA
ncbi:hypothetical protein X975_24655, partial [Stegodyphus mimosarum]